jgi:SAM-dependent methyltransferase
MDMPAFYEGPGLNVETYDERTASDALGVLSGDVEFYLGLAQRTGGPILDLGGGTGRVAWPLADAGYDVWSLDLSEDMQAAGRQKAAQHPAVRDRVTFVQGDMTSFELAERFGLAVIPFRAFQVLLEPRQQRECLATILRHLRPGGLLAFHVFDPLLQYCTPDVGVGPRPERGAIRHPVTGTLVRVNAVERQNDPLRQVMEERWEFEELDSAGAILRHESERLTMRWTYRYEMRYLLELTGFKVDGEFSDFIGSPPAYGREQVWVVSR